MKINILTNTDFRRNVDMRCNLKFLLVLSVELLKARAFPLVAVTKPVEFGRQVSRLKFLIHEITRLLQYPELFPSDVARGRFHAILGADPKLQFQRACENLLLKMELQSFEETQKTQVTRIPYRPGSIGWENFLFNEAPGALIACKHTSPESTVQLVTSVGLRIVGMWERNEADISDGVEAACLSIAQYNCQADIHRYRSHPSS